MDDTLTLSALSVRNQDLNSDRQTCNASVLTDGSSSPALNSNFVIPGIRVDDFGEFSNSRVANMLLTRERRHAKQRTARSSCTSLQQAEARDKHRTARSLCTHNRRCLGEITYKLEIAYLYLTSRVRVSLRLEICACHKYLKLC